MKSRVTKIKNPLVWEMDLWIYESCTAEIACWDDWATIYSIESYEPNQWHCQQLLRDAIEYYKDKSFWWSVALNKKMKHIYQKLNITEYEMY